MVYHDFEYTRPREAKGGIRAQSKRGDFGSSWWARRWVQALEKFSVGSRLARGRSYARRGQVVSIDVGPGEVAASVQGSRKRPYRVSIAVATLPGSDLHKLYAALAERPAFAASLLAGRMPENIEDAFGDVGLSLFPSRKSDLDTDCSCPDFANPCKHIAAVYLLLGEEFDRDPFLIFRMRGIERDELLGPPTCEDPPRPAPGCPRSCHRNRCPRTPTHSGGNPNGTTITTTSSVRPACPRRRPRCPGSWGGSRSGTVGKSSCQRWRPSTRGLHRPDWHCTWAWTTSAQSPVEGLDDC